MGVVRGSKYYLTEDKHSRIPHRYEKSARLEKHLNFSPFSSPVLPPGGIGYTPCFFLHQTEHVGYLVNTRWCGLL